MIFQLAARVFKETPTEIAEVMHTPVFTISADAALFSRETYTENRIGCLPVIGIGQSRVRCVDGDGSFGH